MNVISWEGIVIQQFQILHKHDDQNLSLDSKLSGHLKKKKSTQILQADQSEKKEKLHESSNIMNTPTMVSPENDSNAYS